MKNNLLCLSLALVFITIGTFIVQGEETPPAASSELTFNFRKLAAVMKVHPFRIPTFYHIPNDKSGYKNERIRDIQVYGYQSGVEEWAMDTFLAFFCTENCSFSADRTGDNGDSIGLCQCNSRFRKCAQSYEEQLKQCTQWFLVYTKGSTPQSIYRKIRKGHNSKGGREYENRIREREKLFQPL